MRPGERLAIGLVGCAIMVFVSFRTVADYAKADALGARGQKVDGIVVGTREHSGSKKSGSTDYFVTAEFTLPDGTRVVSEHEVSESCHDRYHEASPIHPMPVTIAFDPSDTGNWHPADDLSARQSTAMWLLVLFPLLALAALALAGWGLMGLIKGKTSGQIPSGYPPGPPPYPQQQYPQQRYPEP